jgi:hypothetical protein
LSALGAGWIAVPDVAIDTAVVGGSLEAAATGLMRTADPFDTEEAVWPGGALLAAGGADAVGCGVGFVGVGAASWWAAKAAPGVAEGGDCLAKLAGEVNKLSLDTAMAEFRFGVGDLSGNSSFTGPPANSVPW